MKIKDVIISEVSKNKGTAAGYKGTAGAQAIAQASGIKDVNQIKVGQTINIPGVGPYKVKAGDTLDKIAAANKVSAAAPAPAPAAPAPADNAAPTAAAPAPAAPAASDGTTQDIERLKKLAIGGDTQPAQDAMAGADAGAAPDSQTSGNKVAAFGKSDVANASPDVTDAQTQTSNYTGVDQRTANARDVDTSDDATAAQTQTSNYTGVDQRTANARDANAAPPVQGYASPGQNQGQGTQSARDASTVPDAAKGLPTSPQVSADTGLSTVPGEVKSGTGGKTNMTTASQDEYAWRAKNPNWNMTGAQYPGAGNWDPRTGRSKQVQAQADANAAAVKGFFNKINPFGKKEQPAAAPAPVSNETINADLDIIRKLSGLK